MSNMTKVAKNLKKALDDSEKRKPNAYDTEAEVVGAEDNSLWVKFPGGETSTPIRKTIDAKPGDKIMVRVSGHRAWTVGNETSPPTDDTRANAVAIAAQPSIDYVSELVDKDVTVRSISAATGYIDDLYSKNITTENLYASTGYINDLTAEHITANDIVTDHETVGTLDANYAHITNGVIDNAKISYADVDDLNAHYASIDSLNAATGRIDNLEANELVVNDTLRANNASIEYLESDWISTDRLVLTGNNKNNYPPVEITESEFNVNKTAYYTKSGDTYTQCTTSSVYDPDVQYYVKQNVKAIIEAINNANRYTEASPTQAQFNANKTNYYTYDEAEYIQCKSTDTYSSSTQYYIYDTQIIVSKDKLIAASMDVVELSAITANMGELTAGKIMKGNNFINLDTSPASMEFKNASTWSGSTQGIQVDTLGNVNIKGKVDITSSDTIPTKDEAQGYASAAATVATNYATAVYGTCPSTGASTAAKVVTLANFSLFTGAKITVKFTNANTAAAPTLNVNGTGAKAIYVNKAVTSVNNPLLWAAGAELHFTYDGTYWNCDDVGYGYSTTCSVGASTAAKTGAQDGAIVTNGTTIALTCTYANSVEGAITFNLASIGAATIYKHNAATSSTNALIWSAGSTVTLVRRGQFWYYVASTTIDGDNITTGKIKANLGGSYIDLDSGDMLLGDASTYYASTQGLMWDESAGTLKIKGQITVESGSNVPTTQELSDAIDGIEIGGRNLCLNSNAEITKDLSTSGKVTKVCDFSDYGKSVLGSIGTKAAISFEAKASAAGLKVGGRYIRTANGSTIVCDATDQNHSITLTTSWVRYEGTCSITATDAGGIFVYTGDNTATSGTVYVRNAMVEVGNKATDWTPAPEDAVNDNLLIGSQKISAWRLGDSASRDTTDDFGVITLTGSSSNWNATTDYMPTLRTSILNGTPLWLSFEYKASTAITSIVLVLAGTALSEGSYFTSGQRTKYSNNMLGSLPAASSWTRKAVAMPTSLSELVDGSGNVNSIYVQFYNRTDNSTVQIRKVKLEHGFSATDWTPSPEDHKTYITRINDAGIRIHPSNTVNNSVVINASGMEVFKGGTASANSVAYYGDTARIGKTANEHIEIGSSAMSYYDGATRYARFGGWTQLGTDSAVHLKASADGLEFAGANGRNVFDVHLSGTNSNRYISERFNSTSAALAGTPVTGTEIYARFADSTTSAHTLYVFTAGTNGTFTYNKGSSNYTATYTASTQTITMSGSNSPKVVRVSYTTAFPNLYTTIGTRSFGDDETDSATAGMFSLAQGLQCYASGEASTALNYGTKAAGDYQTAIGKWNTEDTSSLFVVGNGTSASARHNALAVKSTGIIEAENVMAYGTCSTAAATVQKEVTVANASFILQTGATIAVKFTYANTATNPTLKVNSLTAKAIMRYGTTAAGTSAATSWNANSVVCFVYDGTYWQMCDYNNTTYSGMTDAEYQAGTSTTNRLITPARLKSAIKLWSDLTCTQITLPYTPPKNGLCLCLLRASAAGRAYVDLNNLLPTLVDGYQVANGYISGVGFATKGQAISVASSLNMKDLVMYFVSLG